MGFLEIIQLAFTYSKLTIETLEQDVKHDGKTRYLLSLAILNEKFSSNFWMNASGEILCHRYYLD